MNLYVIFLTTFFELICIYTTVKLFKNISLFPSKNDLIWGLLYLLVICLIPEHSAFLSLLCSQLLYLSYILITFEEELLNKLLLYGISFGYITITQCILACIFSLLSISTTPWYMGPAANLLTFFIILFTLYFTPARRVYSFIIRANFPLKILLWNCYLILLSLLLTIKLDNTLIYENPTYIFTIATLILSINICLFYYDAKVSNQKQALLSYEKNLPIYEALIHEIRSNQHEYANRIQTLQNLTYSCKDFDELKSALNNYTTQYVKPLHAYPLLKVNMPLLAAALYNLSTQAERNHIILQFDVVTNTLNSKIPEYLLTDFVCILTQNAIEASCENDTIYIRISSNDTSTSFEIRNPVKYLYMAHEIQSFFDKNHSQKHNIKKESSVPHGYGLYFLNEQLKKYKGTLRADCVEYDKNYWMIFHLEI